MLHRSRPRFEYIFFPPCFFFAIICALVVTNRLFGYKYISRVFFLSLLLYKAEDQDQCRFVLHIRVFCILHQVYTFANLFS
jgi:hypothetical protein